MRSPAVSILAAPAAVALALAVVPSHARGQLMASEPASVSQTLDGTKVTVEYSRPRARGRKALFGTRVRPGEVWTPGANAATTLALSKDVTIEGRAVPAGKYSVWIVTAPAQWEMVLDPDTARWHTMRPKESAAQHRFPVRREKGPFTEVLTWWFPEVGSTAMTLAMAWDTVRVPLRIAVPASYTRAVGADAARRIVGRYRMVSEPMPAPPGAEAEGEEGPTPDLTLTVRYEGGELRAVMDPPLFRTESGYTDWILVPGKGGAGWYKLGRFDAGELVELVDFVGVHFDPEGEHAKGFEVRATNDMLMARGTRLP